MSGGRKARLAETGFVMFHCPGCHCLHGVHTQHKSPATGAMWTWNGSLDAATLSPSILVRGTVPITDDEHQRIMAGEKIEPKPLVCHSFVRDSRIEFLGDCTHELAGQTVDVPNWD